MNKKQWSAFGIGFFILGAYFGVTSFLLDCDQFTKTRDAVGNAREAGVDEELLQTLTLSNDIRISACFERQHSREIASTIFIALSILFHIASKSEHTKKK